MRIFRCAVCGRRRSWRASSTNGGGFPLFLFRVCHPDGECVDRAREWMPPLTRRYRLARFLAVPVYAPSQRRRRREILAKRQAA